MHTHERARARAQGRHQQQACVRVQEGCCVDPCLCMPRRHCLCFGFGLLGHNERKLDKQRRREQHKTKDRVAYWLIVRSRSGHIFMHTIGDTIDSTIWSSRNELEWILLIVVLWS